MEHIAWVTEERDLLEEISESANKNAAAPTGKVTAEHLKDWLQFLSATELQNYEAYLEKLGLGSTPREERPLRAVAVGQNPDKLFMAGSEKSLPAFARDSTKRLMLTNLDRWLTAGEKMALTGFPVHKDCPHVWRATQIEDMDKPISSIYI